MQLGVNVPNFGPGTDPGVLREWARVVEGLGYDLLMVSDHVTVTPDVAERYPEPFYEPFTTLSWLAGITTTLRLGTTVLVLPYRHPLLVARMATNLQQLSEGRLVLGVGVGWARQEYEALGVPFSARGRLTDLREHVRRYHCGNQPQLHFTETERGVVRGHGDIGDRDQPRAPAERSAMRLRDDWHRQSVDGGEHRRGRARIAQILFARVAGPLDHPRQVGPGAERLARAPDDHSA